VSPDCVGSDHSLLTPGQASRPPVVARVALLGYGRVGQAVAAGIEASRGQLAAVGVSLRCAGAVVRDPRRARQGPVVPCVAVPAAVLERADVVVEVMGGLEPARSLVASALDAGIPVVTANKSLVAHHGHELRALAAARRTTFACEAAVLAGVPFLGALARRPLCAAARRILGIVNGTSHAVADALDRGEPLEAALRDAVARGYAEPDSAADIAGRDAAEKLAILLHLAGRPDVAPERLPVVGLDVLRPADFREARRMGGVIKPIALASLGDDAPGAWVGPAVVALDHPLAALRGVENLVQLTDARGHVVTFRGPGAGPEATARTIIDDVVELLLSGPGARRLVPAAAASCPAPALDAPPRCPWFVRIATPDDSLRVRRIARALADAGLDVRRLTACHDLIVARTAPAPWEAVRAAVAACAPPDRATVLPVIDDSSPISQETPR